MKASELVNRNDRSLMKRGHLATGATTENVHKAFQIRGEKTELCLGSIPHP